jgi:molybdate transport system ATP-binding protein
MLQVSVKKQRGDFRLDAVFEAPAPAVVALFGPSGCGKTTVVNIVAGLLAADAARIEIDGEVLCDTATGLSLPAERRRVGYVFQDARLFPHLDVRRNLQYGFRRSPAGAGRASFDDVVALLGIESLLPRRPHALSGGERQRVALGRALLAQPRLLLLDEPLASLDAARREDVLPYLERVRDHFAIPMIYVSHQFEEVMRLATHVVVIDRGMVMAQGPLTHVALDPALRRLVGAEAVGTVIDGEVVESDEQGGLSQLRVGAGRLHISGPPLPAGTRVRAQLLARDIILAMRPPEALSVRNALAGTITALSADSEYADLVDIDVGGARLLARVTTAATRELGLAPGVRVWALVKAVSIRGRAW